MKNAMYHIENGIKRFAYSILLVVIVVMIFSIFNQNNSSEANIGSFNNMNYNTGWMVFLNDKFVAVENLPNYIPCEAGDIITIKKRLPNSLTDEMCFMARTALEDIYIYIDGKLRNSYATKKFTSMSEYLPSAYVLTELNEEDSGKEILIQYKVKVGGVLNKVVLGYGNSPWFKVIKDNIVLVTISIIIIILGSIVAVFYQVAMKKYKISKSIFYLGLFMAIIGIWIISESRLRQLIFERPSLSSIFSYLSMELIGIFALLFFDEVQHKIHHKTYLVLEAIMSIQLAVNIFLDFTKILSFYESLIFSHIWLVVGIVIIVVNIILDFMHKEVAKYKYAIIGIGFFLLFGIAELLKFYVLKLFVLGPLTCIGLMFLLMMNIIQVFKDVMSEIAFNEKKKQESWINTIETIASAIDAKDEYTGGHSKRVAEYAGLLAREVAPNYGFTEEDITRIRYIGLMHDIGKIGITDDILNKVGKLSDEEFSLMKKHVEIGNVMLMQVGESTEGLLEGIRYHHERFDGRGYPDGLEGVEIPLVARILCLADSYDAMTSNRIYRHRLTDEKVKSEIIRCAGTQFDPALAETFVQLIEKGVIYPISTVNHNSDGDNKKLRSIILEECIKKDKKSGEGVIINPSHVRLACYIMKLAEDCGDEFNVIFIEPKNNHLENFTVEEFLESVLKQHLKTKDINIRYSKNQNLVVLFGRTENELENLLNSISELVNISELPCM